jgi:hypothetical protein
MAPLDERIFQNANVCWFSNGIRIHMMTLLQPNFFTKKEDLFFFCFVPSSTIMNLGARALCQTSHPTYSDVGAGNCCKTTRQRMIIVPKIKVMVHTKSGIRVLQCLDSQLVRDWLRILQQSERIKIGLWVEI